MHQIIQPRTLAKIKDLSLLAKTVAEGFLHGLQKSSQRGVGIEFSQYRAYEVGDQLSRIDWKLFARSDRYFVREAERESEINVWFLLDTSLSMLQSSQSKQSSRTAGPSKNSQLNWNKMEYAKCLIASLAYLAQKQGDTFGYLGLTDKSTASNNTDGTNNNFLPIGGGQRHWQKLLISLNRVEQGNFFPALIELKHHLARLNTPSIIFVISDFYQKENEIIDFMAKLNTSISEVVALQLFNNDEIHFDYQGAIRFRDLETQQEILIPAASIRKDYLEKYQLYQEQLKTKFNQKNIHSNRFNIDLPLDQALYEYIRHRNRLVR